MIELKDVTKIYGKGDGALAAIQDVSFAIPTGATVAIIGKSGSGKSTLMHVMSGLDHATSGEIINGGKSLRKLKAKEMDAFRATEMSFIFQAFFVEANQTCYQNVMLPLEIAGVPAGKRRELVREALAAVELEEKIDVLAGNLSGGQRQRLAIARAIVNKPGLIFADEPTGNLDSTTGDVVMDLLFGLNKKLGCTLIVVTHDDELAAQCQKQIYMKDGKVSRMVGFDTQPATVTKSKKGTK
jgi:putative ABC transport system ATP-binding protein